MSRITPLRSRDASHTPPSGDGWDDVPDPNATGLAGAIDPPSTVSATAMRSLVAALSILRRRWLLAGGAFAVALAPVLVYLLLAVPTYTAKGAVQVATGGMSLSNPLAELTGGGLDPEVQTEVEIMRSKEFLLEVLRGLRLDLVDPSEAESLTTDLGVSLRGRSPVDARLQQIRSLSTLEVDESLTGHLDLELAVEGEAIVLRSTDGEEGPFTGAVGEPIAVPGARISFSALPLSDGETFAIRVLSAGALLELHEPQIRVEALGSFRRPTTIVQVSTTSTDRDTARDVVAAIMDHYVEQSLKWQTQNASRLAEFVGEQIEDVSGRLAAHEEALKHFAERENAVQLDTQARVTIENAASIEAEILRKELQEQVVGSALAGAGSGRTEALHLTGNFVEDPVLASAIAALTEGETQYAMLRASLTEEHPRLSELRERIKRQQHEVIRLMQHARRTLGDQRRELERKRDEATKALSAYPDKELQLARHMRDLEVNQRLYGFLLEKKHEAEIVRASTTTDKRVVDHGRLPHRRSTPQRSRVLLTGMLTALAFSLIAVYVIQLTQRRLGTVESITGLVRFATYGTIPRIAGKPGDASARVLPKDVWETTGSPAIEAFRALCVNVGLMPKPAGRGRVLQVTSGQPGEGKSTVAASLAAGLARTGAKVLLVDLDLRKPVQHRMWSIARSPGYADLAASGASEATIHRPGIDGLDLITAGTRLPDSLASVMSPALQSNIAAWARDYDFVVLDAPPAFVADTTVISRWVDLLLLVARPGVAERASLAHALATLSRSPARIGLVLNGVAREHAEYGASYYEYAAAYGDAGEAKDA